MECTWNMNKSGIRRVMTAETDRNSSRILRLFFSQRLQTVHQDCRSTSLGNLCSSFTFSCFYVSLTLLISIRLLIAHLFEIELLRENRSVTMLYSHPVGHILNRNPFSRYF